MSADSISNKAAKKANQVVASVPPKLGVSTYDWVGGASAKPENRPMGADRAARVGSLMQTAAAGQTPYNYEAGTAAQNTAYDRANMYNQSGPQAGTVDAFAPYGGLAGLVKAIQGGGGSTAGKDSAFDWAKFNAEQAAARNTTDTSLRALQGLQGRLASGGYRGNADTLLGLINDQHTQGQASIWDNYNTGVADINSAYGTEFANANNIHNTGLGNINSGYDTAQGMVNTGYGDLDKYLTANQSNPYANLQQQVSPVNNAMANYLSAYGVSNDPVNQQVQASQMANQQGADSFNQLQQLMSANQLANNQSNLGLSQMARNYATTGLGSQRAGYQANADASRADALNSANQSRTSGLNSVESSRMGAMNQLMDQINQARYGVEQDAGTRKNALEEAIIAAGGSTSATAADVNPDTGRVDTGPAAAGSGNDGKKPVEGSASARAQQVAAAPDNYPNFKAALADLNPNYKFTTMAAAKKKFPSLAKAF